MTEELEDGSVLEMDASAFENAVTGIGRWLAEGGRNRPLPDAIEEPDQVGNDFGYAVDALALEESVGPDRLKGARRKLVGIALAAEREAIDVVEPVPERTKQVRPGVRPEVETPDRDRAEAIVRSALDANGFDEGRSLEAVVEDEGGLETLGEDVHRATEGMTDAELISGVERPEDWGTTPGGRAEVTETAEREV